MFNCIFLVRQYNPKFLDIHHDEYRHTDHLFLQQPVLVVQMDYSSSTEILNTSPLKSSKVVPHSKSSANDRRIPTSPSSEPFKYVILIVLTSIYFLLGEQRRASSAVSATVCVNQLGFTDSLGKMCLVCECSPLI